MEDSGRYRFFNLVKEMRKAQNEYFSTHSHYTLINARNLEQKVDKYIQNGDKYIESKQPQQATLYNMDNATLYLDFGGNEGDEGDVFEADLKDIERYVEE